MPIAARVHETLIVGEKKPERWIVDPFLTHLLGSQLGSYPRSSDMNHIMNSNHLPRFLPSVTT